MNGKKDKIVSDKATIKEKTTDKDKDINVRNLDYADMRTFFHFKEE